MTLKDHLELLKIEQRIKVTYYKSYTDSMSKMVSLKGSGLDDLREKLYIEIGVLKCQIDYLEKRIKEEEI